VSAKVIATADADPPHRIQCRTKAGCSFSHKKETWTLSTLRSENPFPCDVLAALRQICAHSGINYLTVNQYRVVAWKESFSFGDIKATNTVASCLIACTYYRCEHQCYTRRSTLLVLFVIELSWILFMYMYIYIYIYIYKWYTEYPILIAPDKYSLNLNQWIITDISAKYATGNQWIKWAP